MKRNIEIKARASNYTLLADRIKTIADSGPVVILQKDTFFNCQNGRLKLRELSPSEGQLIFYQRADQAGPKESSYVIVGTTEPDALRQSLSLALGVCGFVEKRRLLFMVGNTRIHLDEVYGLGNFLEIEVVLADDETVDAGRAIARDLMLALGISEENLIEGAYVDLL